MVGDWGYCVHIRTITPWLFLGLVSGLKLGRVRIRVRV